MRPGFMPHGSYSVSFVYLHAGAPFARKGDLQMSLPKMDVPVGEVEWEVFAPENYSLRTTGGNVIEQTAFDRSLVMFHSGSGSGSGVGTGTGAGVDSVVGRGTVAGVGAGVGGGTGGGTYRPGFGIGSPGEIRGRVADASGAVLPGVTIELGVDQFRRSTTTDSSGTFALSGVPDGKVTMTATLAGFETQRRQLSFDQQPVQVDFRLRVAAMTETVAVSGKTPQTATTFDVSDSLKKSEENAQRLVEPSQNVINLQRRAAGVLPVRIDVPRAGTSHRFVRPLVVDQETVVALRYKRR
jgi:hypothetical protein